VKPSGEGAGIDRVAARGPKLGMPAGENAIKDVLMVLGLVVGVELGDHHRHRKSTSAAKIQISAVTPTLRNAASSMSAGHQITTKTAVSGA
jgi:hypothetical protein